MHPAPRTASAILLTLALAATGCDRLPTEPEVQTEHVRGAFLLNIDVATGRVTVSRSAPAVRSGASFSLIGDEAIRLHTTHCAWTEISRKVRRCSFDLAVENLLTSVDLVTPTTFPRPPAGSDGVPLEGIFVFPFASAALGAPGSAATPSPDWDNPPANFFNDFASCQSGKTSDCYPSKTFGSPLEAGAISDFKRVGFDVDKSAQSVSVYVVVAADPHDRGAFGPGEYRMVLSADACGDITRTQITGQPAVLTVTQDTWPLALTSRQPVSEGTFFRDVRGFCRFTLPAAVARATVHAAELRLFQESAGAQTFSQLSGVTVDLIPHGPALESGNYGVTPYLTLEDYLSTNEIREYKTVNLLSAVENAVAGGRARMQFRLRFASSLSTLDGSAWADYRGTQGPNPPQLVITFEIP